MFYFIMICEIIFQRFAMHSNNDLQGFESYKRIANTISFDLDKLSDLLFN